MYSVLLKAPALVAVILGLNNYCRVFGTANVPVESATSGVVRNLESA